MTEQDERLRILQSKARLLLTREKELLSMKQAFERASLWLSVMHEISQKVAANVSIEDIVEVWSELSVKSLGFDAAFCLPLQTEPMANRTRNLRFFDSATVGADLRDHLRTTSCGLFNDVHGPDEASVAGLKEIVSLGRFLWYYFSFDGKEGQGSAEYVLVVGFTSSTAVFRPVLNFEDLSYFRMMAHYLRALFHNSRLYAQVVRENWNLEVALEKAQEANRLKGEFLANVSHELRTPLNAIINIPEALSQDFQHRVLWHCHPCGSDYESDEGPTETTDDSAKERCPTCSTEMQLLRRCFFVGDADEHLALNKRAIEGGRTLLHVVNDLLDLTKLDAGKMRLFLSDVQVEPALRTLACVAQSLADAKHLTLTCVSPAEEVSVIADPVKLSQVLLNLVGNAIKFTEPGGRVCVSAIQTTLPDGREGVRFSVEDTGIGIPPDRMHLLFERFSQVDGSHTRKHGGTGLGLGPRPLSC